MFKKVSLFVAISLMAVVSFLSGCDDGAFGRMHAFYKQERNHLQQLHTALLLYAADHYGLLPPMTNAQTAKSALQRYVKNDSAFINPATNDLYMPNPNLSMRHIQSIIHPDHLIAFYGFPRDKDGSYIYVLMLDGHMGNMSISYWPAAERHMTANPKALHPFIYQ